uniref:Capsid scaffolding protein n=1 Tax=Hot spring virus BHS1 TaxID=2024351 RepID=A0A2U7NW22_9VIRU|nr:capsid scaffolding protein [Hot spring virus BHS1]
MSEEQVNTGTPPAKSGDERKTYTQAELDAMFAERARRAADKATSDILAALGVKDIDEAKAKLKAAKEAEDARLSELDKAKKDKAEAEAALANAKAEAAEAVKKARRMLLRSAVIAEASRQQFDDAEIESVWMVVERDKTIADLIKIKDDGESFEGVDKAVKKIAEAHPRWLKSTSRPPTGTPPRAGGHRSNRSDEPIAPIFRGF